MIDSNNPLPHLIANKNKVSRKTPKGYNCHYGFSFPLPVWETMNSLLSRFLPPTTSDMWQSIKLKEMMASQQK